jgi:hypothetical protein
MDALDRKYALSPSLWRQYRVQNGSYEISPLLYSRRSGSNHCSHHDQSMSIYTGRGSVGGDCSRDGSVLSDVSCLQDQDDYVYAHDTHFSVVIEAISWLSDSDAAHQWCMITGWLCKQWRSSSMGTYLMICCGCVGMTKIQEKKEIKQ